MPAYRLVRILLGCGGALLFLAAVSPALGQEAPSVPRKELGKFYREARFQMQLGKIRPRFSLRMPIRPIEHVPSPADTIAQWIAQLAYDYEPPRPEVKDPSKVETWRLIKRSERPRYAAQFNQVKWSYLGNNYLTPLDTSFTQEVRARMQARFGSPTRTLVELDYSRELRREEYIQFEYWFILNDSIPLMVMDVNGPFDRGVVVAGDHRYRNIMFNMRQSFLGLLIKEETPVPFVDYYFNYPVRRWYRTGFDGQQFFTDPIGQPNLARGRPQLAQPGR